MSNQTAENRRFTAAFFEPFRGIQATRRLLLVLVLAFLVSTITSCQSIQFDPNAGAETIFLETLEHPDLFEVEYLRDPASEGPLTYEGTAWTFFWFFPVNREDLGLWLDYNLPPDSEAANVRAKVWTPWYGHLAFFPTLREPREPPLPPEEE